MALDISIFQLNHLYNISGRFKKLILFIANNLSFNNSCFTFLSVNYLFFIKMIISVLILINLLLFPPKALRFDEDLARFIVPINELRSIGFLADDIALSILISLLLNFKSDPVLLNNIFFGGFFYPSL